MKLLITGGSGYIGGRLADYLAADENNEVIVTSRQLPTDKEPVKNIRFVESDWQSLLGFQQIMAGVDIVIHLAGMNAVDIMRNPENAIAFKRDSTSLILQAADHNQVKHVIYFSSAHVYMSPLTGRISEDTIPKSTHPYALAHLAAEKVVLAADAAGGVRGTVIRLSNAYGKPASMESNCWILLVNDLCRQAVTSQRMILKSTGLQRRDFITMTDVCRAARHLMHADRIVDVLPIVNVGGDWSPTIWEMACLIQTRCAEVLGFTPILERVAPDSAEQPDYLDYNIDRLRNTGFSLISNVTEEIDQLLNFCKPSFSPA